MSDKIVPLFKPSSSDIKNGKLLFIPLSGVEQIGMNFYAYGYNGKWLIVDFGMGFASEERGLEGVEILFSSPQFFAKQKNNIVGLVLTHAHEDHIGAIPYLWPELKCPIYGSHFTLGVLREKLRETVFGRQIPLKVFNKNETLALAPFTITPYSMPHSILEQQALLIEVGNGHDEKKLSIIHTGDWKMDHDPLLGEHMDEAGLKNLATKNILAVVSDSTNIFDSQPSVSEGSVKQGLIKTFQKIQNGDYRIDDQPLGMIIATCFASNLERVFSIAHAAEQIGRKVAVVGRAFERYLKVAYDTGYWSQFPKSLQQALGEKDIKRIRRDNLVVIATGSQGETRGAVARISQCEHRTIKPTKGDYMLFSSRVIPGNEVAVAEIKNKLVQNGVRLLDVADEVDDITLHASGHPTRHDLQQLYDWIKPKSLIPVHGEPRHLVEHIDFAKKQCSIDYHIMPYNGAVIEISHNNDNPLKLIGYVNVDCLAKDGYDILSIKDQALAMRRNMAEAGTIMISAVFISERIREYQWSLFGISLSGDQENQMEKVVVRALEAVSHSAHKNKTEEELKKTIKRYMRKNFNKTPLVQIHFLYA
ncbi:MAG: ribonuclease J [Alphaproteobacteria bacterium]